MKVLEVLLILLIIFSPLFYGSVGNVPIFVIEVSSLIIFLLLLFGIKRYNQKLLYPHNVKLVIVFLLIAFLQIIDFPNLLIRIISPNTYLLKQEYGAYVANFYFSKLSFYSVATIEETLKFVSFFSIFICVLNILQTKEQFERVILVLIFLGLCLAFYGIIKKYFILQRQISNSFSTFGNRNHFAAYMTMISTISVSYALYCKNKYKKIIFGFIATVICASVFLSLSRGGAISLAAALILMFCFIIKERAQSNQHWIIIGVITFAVALMLIAGLGPFSGRMSTAWSGFMNRWSVVVDSATIIKNFPLSGIGLGNFSYIFTFYQKTNQLSVYYDYLHNDYLQFLIEAGVVCSILVLVFFFNLFKGILIEANTRRDHFVKNIVIGGLCGMFGVIMHSFIDFNFHIPAVSFLFWLLLGLTYKCAFTHFYFPKPDDNK